MILTKKTTDKPEHESPKKLSKKEFAKKLRHEAYLRAKEFRKIDPRQIAMKEEEKERSREAYQKVKGRNKAYRDKIKKAKKEKSTKKRLVKREELKKMVMPGSTVEISTSRN